MRTLAVNGCMWFIVSMTGLELADPSSMTIVAISSLRVKRATDKLPSRSYLIWVPSDVSKKCWLNSTI